MVQYLSRSIRIFKLLAAITAVVYFAVGLLMLDMGEGTKIPVGCEVAQAAVHDTYGAQAMCPMQANEHLAWWNSTFTSIPTSNSLLGLLALMATLLFIGVVLSLFESYATLYARHVAGSKDPPDDNLHDYFIRFLAAGKAQPLLYA